MSDHLSSDRPHIWLTHKAGLNRFKLHRGRTSFEQLFLNNRDLRAARPTCRAQGLARDKTTIGFTGDGQRDRYLRGHSPIVEKLPISGRGAETWGVDV